MSSSLGPVSPSLSSEEEETGKTVIDLYNKMSSFPHSGNSQLSSHTLKNTLFIQMQLCKKESLKDWLDNNQRNRKRTQVLDYFKQVYS